MQHPHVIFGRLLLAASAMFLVSSCEANDFTRPAGQEPFRYRILDDGTPAAPGQMAESPWSVMSETLAVDLEYFPIGPVPVTNGISALVELDVPPEIDSISGMIFAGDDVHTVLWSLDDPAGEVWVTDRGDGLRPPPAPSREFVSQFHSPNRTLAGAPWGTFLLPNTPSLALSAGTYRIRFGAFILGAGTSGRGEPFDGVAEVALVARRGPPLARGRLAVGFYFAGTSAFSAATAGVDVTFRDVISRLEETLSLAHIQLDVVAYENVIGAATGIVQLDGDDCTAGDPESVFSSVALREGREQVIPVYLVDRFRCAGPGGLDVGGGIAGLTTTIPGAASASLSRSPGVIIATSGYANDPAALSRLIAHELGHFLGLFHTRESITVGGEFIYDTIPDTPQDDPAVGNLMDVDPQSSTISAGQEVVMLRSPWVRPLPTAAPAGAGPR